jgi:hypothetical protein
MITNDRSFRRFLDRSLTVLEQDVPAAHARVRRLLGTMRVSIGVDAEQLTLFDTSDGIRISNVDGHHDAKAVTTRGALADLLNGRLSLEDAILADRVMLRGSVDDLADLYDALLVYFRGAVGTPRFAVLLEEFLEAST